MVLGKLSPKNTSAPEMISSEGMRQDPSPLRRVIKILGVLPTPLKPFLKPALAADKIIEITTDPNTGKIDKIKDISRELLPTEIDLVLDLGEKLMGAAAGKKAAGIAGDLADRLWDALKNPPPKNPQTGEAQQLTLDQLPPAPKKTHSSTGEGGGRITRQRKDFKQTAELTDPTWYYMIDDNNLDEIDIERFRDDYYDSDGSQTFKEFTQQKLAEKQQQPKKQLSPYPAYQKQDATANNIINQIINLSPYQEIIFEKGISFAPVVFLFLLS